MYKYQDEKHNVFTDDGPEMLAKIRENVEGLFDVAGCATVENMIRGCTGDTFTMLACLDFLEERGRIVKIYREGISAQRQIYVRGRTD